MAKFTIGSDINSGNCPHVDPNAHYGHGTMVSGIAVGNGNSVPDSIEDYSGYAYDADILVVSSDFNAMSWTQTVADGVDWIFSEAEKLGKPCVINISAGTYLGSHDGQDISALVIDSLIKERRGRAVVCAAGNAGGQAPFHVKSILNNDTSFTWFTRNNLSSFGGPAMFIEAWGDSSNMKQLAFSLSLTNTTTWKDSLYSTDSVVNALGKQSIHSVIGGGTMITLAKIIGGQYRIQVLVLNPPANNYLKLTSVGVGEFDCWGANWLGMSDIVGAGLPPSSTYPEIVNYQLPDTLQSLVSSWNCSPSVISVGNYNNRLEYENVDGGVRQTVDLPVGGIGKTSSRGPTRLGYLKPDISAPGNFTLTTAKMSDISILTNTPSLRYKLAKGGYHVSNGGTSMASPVVAGLVARYLEKCPNSSYLEIKESLIQTAFTDTFTGVVPNYSFGAGKVDASQFLEHSHEYDTLVSWPSKFAFCDYDSLSISVSQPQLYSVFYWSNEDSLQSLTIDTSNNQLPIKAWFTGPKGCIGFTDTSYAMVYKSPEILFTSDSAFCSGTSDSILVQSSDSTVSWVWNKGETTNLIVVNQPGTYSVNATSVKGCVNSDSVRVDTFKTPQFSILSDSVFCLEEGDTLFAKSIDSNIKWLWNSGDTMNYILIDSSGLITLKGENHFGCISSDTVLAKGILCYVSVDENRMLEDIQVYPNPTSDFLTIDGGVLKITEIELYNIHGQQVLAIRVDSFATQIDLSGVPIGTYYLKSNTEKGFTVLKVSIAR